MLSHMLPNLRHVTISVHSSDWVFLWSGLFKYYKTRNIILPNVTERKTLIRPKWNDYPNCLKWGIASWQVFFFKKILVTLAIVGAPLITREFLELRRCCLWFVCIIMLSAVVLVLFFLLPVYHSSCSPGFFEETVNFSVPTMPWTNILIEKKKTTDEEEWQQEGECEQGVVGQTWGAGGGCWPALVWHPAGGRCHRGAQLPTDGELRFLWASWLRIPWAAAGQNIQPRGQQRHAKAFSC